MKNKTKLKFVLLALFGAYFSSFPDHIDRLNHRAIGHVHSFSQFLQDLEFKTHAPLNFLSISVKENAGALPKSSTEDSLSHCACTFDIPENH